MLFKVLPTGEYPDASSGSDRDQAFLRTDEWNDWFKYQTLFRLTVIDSSGSEHDLGRVKIGQKGLRPPPPGSEGMTRPDIPDAFDELDERFFSLGMDENYYEMLVAIPLGPRIMKALRDIAADPDLFRRFREEDVMKESLLRSVDSETVTGRFWRIIQRDAKLTPFDFSYTFPAQRPATPLTLTFEVRPESRPPTNIHVLIGRNGVGKTRGLHQMSRALVEKNPTQESVGKFVSKEHKQAFANLVSVTFSAFDPFDPLTETGKIGYAYVGLKSTNEVLVASDTPVLKVSRKRFVPKSPNELADDFIESMLKCRGIARRRRWREALQTLESDPLFKDAGVVDLTELDDADCDATARQIYSELSSGHKIVLLTMARLVEEVDERTLVLLDEPEAHLHPPLLAAFIRALSDLLVKRNGVAIVATHSPVVLQEVPKECAWILRRTGHEVRADRPECETFGENVGILTTEVFGLEVSRSGVHKMLEDVVARSHDYNEVIRYFDNKLGAEARAIARAMFAAKRS